MEKTDTVIIGAGVVGLAIAERLSRSGKDLIVLERNDSFGRETSSRNSEVIHAGFYYPTGSLKATLCVEGNRLVYEFCRDHDLPFRECGKLLIARTLEDEAELSGLFNQGNANGVEGLELLGRSGIAALEPTISGSFGLHSPATGIFDTHSFMKRLESLATGQGAMIAYGCEVVAVSRCGEGYEIDVRDADGSRMSLRCAVVINAAGLLADKVSAMAGIDLDAAGYHIQYCKGEYFSTGSHHRGRLSHLVYPAPTSISLGIHGVLSLDGNLKLGPSAFFVDEIDYTVNPTHRSDFFKSAIGLFPFLTEEELTPDMAGIRPKLKKNGGEFRDFIIREERDRGLPGFINLVGIESPGLTSSLAIGRHVEKMVTGLG